MSIPKDEIREEMAQAWGIYLAALGKSIALMEKRLAEAKELAAVCNNEWCMATEHVIDDLANALFSISEPRWLDDRESKKLKALKHKLHDIYADYRGIYQKMAS